MKKSLRCLSVLALGLAQTLSLPALAQNTAASPSPDESQSVRRPKEEPVKL